jgi:hypothetical protein
MGRMRALYALVGVSLAMTGCEITPQQWGPVTSSYDGKVRVEGN